MQRPVQSFLQLPDNHVLYAMAGKTRMELTESKKPYAKRPEQPEEGGMEYQKF